MRALHDSGFNRTAAAARLNLSKSVISKRISDLETVLGTEKWARTRAHEVMSARLR